MAKSRAAKTPAQAAAKWLAAMQGTQAQTNYAQGTANKGQVAMNNAASPAAMQSYVQGVQNSVNNGSRLASLQDPMSAQLYNANTGAKGAQQLGVGAQKKVTKYQAAINALQPVYQAMQQASLAVDPNKTRATAGARAAAALQVLMQAGKKGGGGLLQG